MNIIGLWMADDWQATKSNQLMIAVDWVNSIFFLFRSCNSSMWQRLLTWCRIVIFHLCSAYLLANVSLLGWHSTELFNELVFFSNIFKFILSYEGKFSLTHILSHALTHTHTHTHTRITPNRCEGIRKHLKPAAFENPIRLCETSGMVPRRCVCLLEVWVRIRFFNYNLFIYRLSAHSRE